MIRNNYALETAVSWIEGLSLVGALAFLFFNWKMTVACAAVFLVSLPLRNFIKYGMFYPEPIKSIKESTLSREPLSKAIPKNSSPISSPVVASSQKAKAI